jgi:XTP/dITP diphosphohydrolase
LGVIILLLATRNTHKVTEIRDILGTGFRFLTLDDFPGSPAIVEDAPTFAGNATKKSLVLARWLVAAGGGPLPDSVLADDSGLEVDALGGVPGVHSARFAALDTGAPGNSSDTENKAKLVKLLRAVPLEKRTARFRCVLALTPVTRAEVHNASPVCSADELEFGTELFDGACEGRIILAERGHAGFGYDPLFVPTGHEKSFGELGEEVKNQISHRARALEKLRKRLSRRI